MLSGQGISRGAHRKWGLGIAVQAIGYNQRGSRPDQVDGVGLLDTGLRVGIVFMGPAKVAIVAGGRGGERNWVGGKGKPTLGSDGAVTVSHTGLESARGG